MTMTREVKINNRHLVTGTELSIRGERGRFKFLAYHVNDQGDDWITCWGGPKNRECYRSFDLSRVRVVHRTRTRFI